MNRRGHSSTAVKTAKLSSSKDSAHDTVRGSSSTGCVGKSEPNSEMAPGLEKTFPTSAVANAVVSREVSTGPKLCERETNILGPQKELSRNRHVDRPMPTAGGESTGVWTVDGQKGDAPVHAGVADAHYSDSDGNTRPGNGVA